MTARDSHVYIGHRAGRLGLFYGWWIVAGCVVMLTLSSGIGFYGLPVFLPFLERAFQASPAFASLGATAFFLVFGLAGPSIGRRVDRYGPRSVMFASSLLFGAGLIGLALSRALWQTYAAYAVIAVGFSGTSLISVSALISNWFQARRGLAMSLAMCGISIGGVLIAPLATRLILAYGWRAAALALAALAWGLGLPLVALVIRNRPADLGLHPDGTTTPVLPSVAAVTPPPGVAWSLAAARRSPGFWAIGIAYLLVSLTQTGVLSHQVRFLTYGSPEEGAVSPQAAALTISLTALASIAGRLAFGAVVDRVDRRRAAAALMVVQGIAAIALLLARGNLALVVAAGLTFGAVMGCVLMLQALFVTDLFGVASLGAIYGASLLVATVGMAGGPWLAGLLFTRFGNYDVAFGLLAVAALAAGASITYARPATPPPTAL